MSNLNKYYFKEEHELFRQSLKDFLNKEVVPHVDAWEEAGELPHTIWKQFGDMGYFGLTHDEKYGGLALDFWYDVIFLEEISKVNSAGFGASISAHPYLTLCHLHHSGSEYLKEKYLRPGIAGDLHGALGITEPFAGSDVAGIKTTATKDSEEYVINGSKVFITNGVYADYMIVACKTKPDAGASGISLIVVDMNSPGISTSKLKKLGWKASDTGELAFDNVRVPVVNLIGEENKGFYYIMQRFELERLTLAIASLAASEYAIEYSLQYMSERKAFGKTINKFQVLRHRIAQMSAEIEACKTFTYNICQMYKDGRYCVKEASMSKMLATELADKVIYQCLQFFGGYGFMEEYKVARMYRDSRLGPIGGGSSEIMCEIIAKMVIDDVSYESQESRAKNQDGGQSDSHRTKDGGPQSIADIFATLPGRLKTDKAAGKELNVHFKFPNEQYTVSINGGQLTVDHGLTGEANCLVETDDATYIAVETGKINPQEAFMTGKIKVSDLGVMMQFGSLIRKLED
jgi:alkylation response protein AidB-like acyl-CoA dehydrogenase/putative sterol carrier protein